jgi:hypothetical protein
MSRRHKQGQRAIRTLTRRRHIGVVSRPDHSGYLIASDVGHHKVEDNDVESCGSEMVSWSRSNRSTRKLTDIGHGSSECFGPIVHTDASASDPRQKGLEDLFRK